MKNFKVGKKLVISFGIILLLFFMSVVVVAISLNGIKAQLSSFYTGPWESRALANDISSAISEQQKYLYKAISTTDESIITPALAKVSSYESEIQEKLKDLETKVQSHNVDKVKNLESQITKWYETLDSVLKLVENTSISSDEVSEYMQKNTVNIINDIETSIHELVFVTNQVGENFISDINDTQLMTTLLLIILCLSSIVIGIFLCIYITKSITIPLKEIEFAADQMAEGHLKVSLEYDSKDELGNLSSKMKIMADRIFYYMTTLSDAMEQVASGDLNVKRREPFLGDFSPVQLAIRKLVDSLNDTLVHINESADQVAMGAKQVSSGSQALSQGATEQATSIEDLAMTINEISGQIGTNAKNAQEASEIAAETGNQMTQSNQSMQEMIQAMNEITDSSNEIGKIIKTIEDIAFQTNILALNAAVEAARAGAAGKGFAVVADEVRNLASKSSEASKSTSVLIEGALRSVEKGARIADETAQALLSAVEGSKAVTATIDQISHASKEQTSSIERVTQGIDQISSVVQTNSATAEESAASSEELSGQAQMLKNLVKQFQLKRDEESSIID